MEELCIKASLAGSGGGMDTNKEGEEAPFCEMWRSYPPRSRRVGTKERMSALSRASVKDSRRISQLSELISLPSPLHY